MSFALIILAGGKGSRMNSNLPKVMHPLGQVPMLAHVLRTGEELKPRRTVMVVGHGAEQVSDWAKKVNDTITIVVQNPQLGTAHGVAQAKDALADYHGDVVIMYGDSPLILPSTLKELIASRSSSDLVILGFHSNSASGYGRLIMKGNLLERIVEEKDATEKQQQITLCNSGLMAGDKDLIFDLISDVHDDNAASEYYLTDIISIARNRGLSCSVVTCPEEETLGINSQAELARAEACFQARKRCEFMEKGVTLVAPETVHFAFDTIIAPDVKIDPYVIFGPSVEVNSGSHIRSFSFLEGAIIGEGCTVGPFARLRPETTLAEGARVGNFVELKKTELGKNTKVNHLSYLGDTQVGETTNIGAGTIACNYDGVGKSQTKIGDRAFVGSNTMFVAPVTVGDDVMVATGTVVDSDIEDGALAIGRTRMSKKLGGAGKMFALLRSRRK
ncbi:MAG: bifunctional UDP-N-acetylglucosamine diphosphorylase/glucosamine-1-phosphate N-acetyltransferase GlmU [Aestuariivita sp.]|nr:bifunctional UDP-N-acetylglucosamine diphosphorylase/glucosamine-1-phosphate N-acetyltransferase GlmU [Aestuariivita sp.]MCY4202728.1 bifunctional UDP-N-acetylglucosamine diphosphorylase/glucosamine-1-phosphate N-acetyltransferase GlmU [Aestuariivita sp.]